MRWEDTIWNGVGTFVPLRHLIRMLGNSCTFVGGWKSKLRNLSADGDDFLRVECKVASGSEARADRLQFEENGNSMK